MPILRDMHLVPVSTRAETGFLDAARALLAAHSSAIAILDAEEHVVGLFTDDDLLRGLFPKYLSELRHTAFLVDEGQSFDASIAAAAAEPVSRYMREPVTVEIDASAAHVVERFLHTPWGAMAVVEAGRFVGMVGQLEFTECLIERLDRRAGEGGEMG
jgi:CBS-domain-containing membrane protein